MSLSHLFKYLYRYNKYKDIHPRYLIPTSEHNFLKRLSNEAFGQKVVVFDVGSHVGETLEKFDALFSGEIHCFEPFPDTFESLKAAHISGKNNIQYNNLGLSNFVGKEKFYINSGSPTNSSLRLHKNFNLNWNNLDLSELGSCFVNYTTIDAYCAKHSIIDLFLLKIDTQGSEGDVVEGAQNTLQEKRVKYIMVETQVTETYENQTLYFELLAKMHHLGYRLINVINIATNEADEILQFDLVFTRN